MFLLKSIVLVSVICLTFSNSIEHDDDLENKIIGGGDAKEGSATYQVSIQYGTIHNCGGAIVHARFILTAAHCLVVGPPEIHRVMVGSNKLSEGSVFYKPEKFIVHSRYNQPQYHNDIGLIKLKENIEFNDKVNPIDYEWREVPNFDEIRLTGWGRTGSTNAPDTLQEINLIHISYEDCIEKFNDDGSVDYGHLCTYNKVGEGACNGDSGSPLVHNGKVVAVVNFGIPCAQGFPDVHARVGYYHDWIRTNINTN